MDVHAKALIVSVLRVVLAGFFLVASVAFATIPYALGYHPGESVPASDRQVPRHLS